jgi:hypothetical protein
MSETPETGMKLDIEYLKRQKEAKNYIAQIADHQDRFVYKGNYYDVENCINAERQRDEAIKLREEEIAEFNEGVKDYGRGVSYDDLEGGAHDVKAVGYAWAAFDDLRKERDEAVRLIEEEALEFIEGQEDVADGDDGRPRPNRAMQIAQELRQFLATLDRTEKT